MVDMLLIYAAQLRTIQLDQFISLTSPRLVVRLVRTIYQSIIAHCHMLTGLCLNPMGISYRMSGTNVLVSLRLQLREADGSSSQRSFLAP